MIELRWITREISVGFNNVAPKDVLQYRQKIPCVDASGALCPSNIWEPWKDVPYEVEEEI